MEGNWPRQFAHLSSPLPVVVDFGGLVGQLLVAEPVALDEEQRPFGPKNRVSIKVQNNSNLLMCTLLVLCLLRLLLGQNSRNVV
jgi:hypothetical protein